jgi:phospholipid/cholesterol/gamma-HCH transport system permease protein
MTANPAGVVRVGVLNPVGRLGNAVLSFVAYFGGLALLGLATAGLALKPWGRLQLADSERPLFSETLHQLSWMLAMGVPLVGLVHVGMGSFLALQAYYGSTFVDGTGAVVGVGLARNLAALMTGLTLSGFLSARMIPELRALRNRPVQESRVGSRPNPARDDRPTIRREEPLDLVAAAAPRILAATVASPVLAFWGFVVGTFVGWQCADSMLGLMPSTFFLMFLRMIWYRDIVGLVLKGLAFGFVVGLIACFEGVRGRDESVDGIGPETSSEAGATAVVRAVMRSTCIAMVAILVVNSSWFILAYHSVPSWGPTLLKPPSP